ncbi:MAG: ferric reductase-like transmembrane domain-containing protein [Nocardioides sp.]
MGLGVIDDLIEGPVLWFLNRSTGFVMVSLLTLSVLLGMASTAGRGEGVVARRFLSQALHRNVSLLALVTLTVHVGSAVIDTYEDIRWWQAFSPIGATYRPLWLALGSVALDIIVLVTLTSLTRTRMSHRPWQLIHRASYAAWALGVAHGLGIGTDMTGADSWGVRFSVGCVVLVACAGAVRLSSSRHRRQFAARGAR